MLCTNLFKVYSGGRLPIHIIFLSFEVTITKKVKDKQCFLKKI